jgi:hypothetical protein
MFLTPTALANSKKRVFAFHEISQSSHKGSTYGRVFWIALIEGIKTRYNTALEHLAIGGMHSMSCLAYPDCHATNMYLHPLQLCANDRK